MLFGPSWAYYLCSISRRLSLTHDPARTVSTPPPPSADAIRHEDGVTPPPKKSSTRKRTLDIERNGRRPQKHKRKQHHQQHDPRPPDGDDALCLLGPGGVGDGAEDNLFVSPPKSSVGGGAATGERPPGVGGGVPPGRTPRTPRPVPSVAALDDPIRTPADFYQTGYTPLPGPGRGTVVPDGAFADGADLLGIFSPGGLAGPGDGDGGGGPGAAPAGTRGLVLLDGFRTPHRGRTPGGGRARGRAPPFPRAYAYGGMLMNAHAPHASQRPRVCMNNFRFGRVAVVGSGSSPPTSSSSSVASSPSSDGGRDGVQREVAISPISDLRSMSERGWPGLAPAGPSAGKARLPALGGFVTPSVSVSSSRGRGGRSGATHPLTVSSCASSVVSAGLPSLGAISINPELQKGGARPPTSTPAGRPGRAAASGARGSALKSADAEKFWSSVGAMTPNVGCEHQFVANLLEEDGSRLANDLIDL